jgi:hypothetical protein
MKKAVNNTQKDFIQLLENTQPINDTIVIEKPNSKYEFPAEYKNMLIKDAKKFVNIESNRILKSYNSQNYQSVYVWCMSQTKEYLLEYSNKIKKYKVIERESQANWKLYSSHETEMTWKEYENKDKTFSYEMRKIDLPMGASGFLLDIIENNFLR